MVLVGGAIYEVADPVHPKLLCTIRNTAAHLYTGDTFTYVRGSAGGFDVVLHSMGSGNESVIGSFPLAFNQAAGGYPAWTPDGSVAASETQDTNSSGDQVIHVWLSSQRGATEVYSFPLPLTDCICRFGLAPPTLSFSPDGVYLLSGWPIGKGGFLAPLEVHRVSDQSLVKTFDVGTAPLAIWERTGHRLLLSGSAGVQAWTPEGGIVSLGSAHFGAEPSLSPDGLHVAYTSYTDPAVPASLRVYTYDVASNQERLLVDTLRSEVLFVKDGWVWYREELECGTNSPTCPPWGTSPGDRVFAMDLAVGAETPVVFAAGESPSALQSAWAGQYGVQGPEFWPNS